MRFILPALVCLMLFDLTGFAQTNAFSGKDHVLVKFAPLALFDIDNTVQFGIEVPLRNRKFSLQQDLGYGHSSFSIWYSGYDSRPNKAIFKSRSQLRFYYFDRQHVRGYVAGEFLFKKVVYKENKYVGRDCANGNCGYFENKDIKSARNVGACHVKAGWQFYFSNRMAMDLFAGFGLRQYRVVAITKGVQDWDFQQDSFLWEGSRPGTIQTLPSLALGVHLGIVLGKVGK